ncbi:MAG: ATP-binding cassette domain-containing protein [Candidatus Enteromonas sp.]
MIDIEHLSKSFGKREIYKDLSVSFPSGSLVGLFGPSGCGKSTLLNMISLLEPIDKGTISFQKGDYTRWKGKKREQYRVTHFSYVFPEASLLACLNVKENLLFPLQLQNLPIDESKVQFYCDKLGLTSFLEADVTTLSSGEKQRVALARALLLPHPVMIADEPTSHLDPELSKEIILLLKEVAKKESRLILCSCHDAELFDFFDIAYDVANFGLIPHESKR